MSKTALPTIFLESEDEERLYEICKTKGISRTEFCTTAIMNSIAEHTLEKVRKLKKESHGKH